MVVIGAGVGGLACAIELAAEGTAVTVLERAAGAGGKLRAVMVDGEPIDAGPTVLTMRWVFDELFARAGVATEAQLALRPLQTLARHAWRDGEPLDLYRDLEAGVAAIARFAGPRDAARYRDYCARAQRIHDVLEAPFLRASRPNPLSLLVRGGLRGLPDMLRISPFRTLWAALARQFEDARLRQLFGRYATYCGSSPFAAPATLMLVSHVERQGVWTVAGGMHRLAAALCDTARQLGVRFCFSTHAERIVVERGRAVGVSVAGGDHHPASAVVFNGDVAGLGRGLLGSAVAARAPGADGAVRSLSAVTWNLRAKTAGLALGRHNVFFSGDSRHEFDALFGQRRLPEDATVYVCAQDRGEPEDLPDGAAERLLCLVNAPACSDRSDGSDHSDRSDRSDRGDGGAIHPEDLERCERRMWQRLEQSGLTVQPLSPPTRTTPAEFARLHPGSDGALYGQASHGWMASFRRPGSRTQLPGLYLAGGTTHPGPGMPMAALSGRLAAASLLEDRRAVRVSTSTSSPAAMPGGISTR